MRAFVKEFRLIKLSIIHDGITIYRGREKICKDELRDKIDKSMRGAVDKKVIRYDRSLNESSSDHKLFHQDNNDREKYHCHIKLKSTLTRDQIIKLSDLFVEHGLMSSDERDEFIRDYDKRYQSVRSELSQLLKREQKQDTLTIINFIKDKCDDIDILADLHQHLLAQEYHYLRVESEVKWKGTCENGSIGNTSQSWAMIEKSIALKMAKSIRDSCDQFTTSVTGVRAKQFRDQYGFFAIKRKANVTLSYDSKIFTRFLHAKGEELDASSEKHFRRFSLRST